MNRKLCVVNEVCTLYIGRAVDPMLCCMTTHGKLCKATFPAHVSKSRTSTNCLFETGNLVNTGSVNCLSALLSASSFIDRLNRDMGYDLEICNFDVQNIVGATKLPHSVNLNLLLADGVDTLDRKWEPKLFQGLKLERPGIVFIIFTSGNVIATGAKTIEQLPEAEKTLRELELWKYEIGKEYRSPKGIKIYNAPTTRTKKVKKPNQFKVINYNKKKALFKASVQSNFTSGVGNKKKANKRILEPTEKKNNKRANTSSSSRKHVQFQRIEALDVEMDE